MGRCLSCRTIGSLLKCDCPDSRGANPCNAVTLRASIPPISGTSPAARLESSWAFLPRP
jgi:hypothetical protein